MKGIRASVLDLGFKSNQVQINPNHLGIFPDFDFEKFNMGKSNQIQIIGGFGFDLKHKIRYTDQGKVDEQLKS